jgi:DNA-binding CsgD family transcriptional regulator
MMRGCDVGCPQGAIHNGWATKGRLMIVINRLPRSRQDLERTDDMHGRALGWARAEAALEVFELCGLAVVLCDRFGKVLRLNDAAQGLLQNDLRIVQGRLVCANRETTLMLEQALPRLQAAGRRGRAVDRPITVLRAGRRPILVYPMRLASVCADSSAPCQSLMVLIDLDAQPTLPPQLLSLCFGLSAAEARLAARFAAGEGLETAAQELAITKATARNQLKAIFAKTGVHRQSELTALLARLPDFESR